MSVSPIPVGHRTLAPYLIVHDASRALGWYVEGLGGRELMRLSAPGGKIGHAEIEIGDSRFMLADESPAHDARSPQTPGGSPVSLHLYVPDVDAVIATAAAAGAVIKARPEDKFYGDRIETLIDPFGHTWHVSTHIEDVTVEEIERRMAAMFGKGDATDEKVA